jgi:hypothetical protein
LPPGQFEAKNTYSQYLKNSACSFADVGCFAVFNRPTLLDGAVLDDGTLTMIFILNL